MSESTPRRFWPVKFLSTAAAMVLSACKVAPPAHPQPPDAPETPPASRFNELAPAHAGSARSSPATSPRAYRKDCAAHLYSLNAARIYKGRMQPLLYAVGVMNVEVDASGHVTRLDWLRAPSHAPEVMAEIERTIRQASPFPAPVRLGKVVYTDTWLWDKSGQFQLDTLTEGQD